ncbi:MAG: DNA/RNA helicase domain-containing protein, partial [Velocimicrobium sp.]
YNVAKRTLQHLEAAKKEGNWQSILKRRNASLYIIGHEHFNKSLTLDIENKLMLYMSSVKAIKKIHNKRGNQQNKYYTSDEFEKIFNSVWSKLGQYNSELFPDERSILESAIFKASPLHKLTPDQEDAKKSIIKKIKSAVKKDETGQIIFISGEAGTGKTVLNSSLFYELCTYKKELGLDDMKCHLLVNHDQQLIVYKQIAEKLNLENDNGDAVSKPTSFITNHSENNPVDVVLIDEAHLLWTQGKQAYRGKNQLLDILNRAKVVVVMFDKNQILRTEQYWENELIESLEQQAKGKDNYIKMKNQLRIRANDDTINWIKRFTKEQVVDKIPRDKHYEIRIFDSPQELQDEIKNKATKENKGLSRLVATFDWEYKDKKTSTERLLQYEVSIGKWKMPWNLQIPVPTKEKRKNKGLAWAEQSQTIDEVGSTFTIQGFDLNYAGVILGPSVKYKEGKIVFDPTCSKNQNATKARSLNDGSKRKFGETLIKNEVNVLMTRGVDGLYIYAQDPSLREALKKQMYTIEKAGSINELR